MVPRPDYHSPSRPSSSSSLRSSWSGGPTLDHVHNYNHGPGTRTLLPPFDSFAFPLPSPPPPPPKSPASPEAVERREQDRAEEGAGMRPLSIVITEPTKLSAHREPFHIDLNAIHRPEQERRERELRLDSVTKQLPPMPMSRPVDAEAAERWELERREKERRMRGSVPPKDTPDHEPLRVVRKSISTAHITSTTTVNTFEPPRSVGRRSMPGSYPMLYPLWDMASSPPGSPSRSKREYHISIALSDIFLKQKRLFSPLSDGDTPPPNSLYDEEQLSSSRSAR